jgi:ribonucleoside-diphosphate reductase alpha chain
MKKNKKLTYEELSVERKKLQAEGQIPDWYTTAGWQLFKDRYLYKASGIKEQFERIASVAASHLPEEYRQSGFNSFFKILWDGELSASTPVLSNTGTDRGLPVSCQGAYVDDSILGIYNTKKQLAVHSKKGFGTSAYIGNVRPRGTKISVGGSAEGKLPVITGLRDDMTYVSQGGVRRGSVAVYTELDDPDFDEIVDYAHANPEDLNIGWNVSNKLANDIWVTKDPEACRRFSKAMARLKMPKGKGYWFFPDKANELAPLAIKNSGITIKASNLCTEIMLPSDDEYNFVCVLSSLNLIHWDKLQGNDTIFWATVFLACINKEFIKLAKGIEGLEKSVKAAEDFAAVGLGVLGWHSLLQKDRIPFGSFEAHMLNNRIFARIEEESQRANKWLAEIFGESKFTKGLGIHCATTLAIAPTKSTAALMGGMSEGINPDASMVFTQNTPAGDVNRINPFLLEIMKERGVYDQEEVDDIASKGGSVQDRDWLTEHEKKVFLNAFELNMLDHLRLCSSRQRRIDQGQSINLYFPGDADPNWIMKVHKQAFLDPYTKSLYYIYSTRLISGVNKVCEACQ